MDEKDWNIFTNKIMRLFDRNEELKKENIILQRHFEAGQKEIEELKKEIASKALQEEEEALGYES